MADFKQRVTALLKRIEQSGMRGSYGDYYECCPDCANSVTHSSDCELAALLKECEPNGEAP